MQALWFTGLAGGVVVKLAEPGQSVVDTVAAQPLGVWAIGPLFAALTGLAFKEGACYGKAEAWALFVLTPVALVGHLSGLASSGTEGALLLATVACTLCLPCGSSRSPRSTTSATRACSSSCSSRRQSRRGGWLRLKAKAVGGLAQSEMWHFSASSSPE